MLNSSRLPKSVSACLVSILVGQHSKNLVRVVHFAIKA